MLALYSIILFLIIKRALPLTNIRYDKKLGIKTRGLRKWDKSGLYNRTESTPYLALKKLVEVHPMKKTDELVDFGAGKGRASIYLHEHYKIPVTGIEINELTYDEAINNVNEYLKLHNDYGLKMKKQYAQEYKIEDNQNKFFFFNPFDVSIFKEVVNNIIGNAIKNEKEVEIILYYPVKKYVEFLNNHTDFVLQKRFSTVGALFLRENIEIYKFRPNKKK